MWKGSSAKFLALKVFDHLSRWKKMDMEERASCTLSIMTCIRDLSGITVGRLECRYHSRKAVGRLECRSCKKFTKCGLFCMEKGFKGVISLPDVQQTIQLFSNTC